MRTSTSLQIRLNSTTLSKKPWTRRAWTYLLFLCKYVVLAERYAAKDSFRFRFHHLVGCYHPKKLKIERRQKTKLREKQCAYFHDSCSRRHFDSPETLRTLWRRGTFSSPEPTILLACGRNRELWEQPFWNNKGNNRILPIRFNSVFIYGQEPITRSLHLPYKPYETTFALIFLFLETVRLLDWCPLYAILNN